jgi:hypothetical protein
MNNKCGLTVEMVNSELAGVSCSNHTLFAKRVRFKGETLGFLCEG